MMKLKIRDNNRGIALIVTVGVLSMILIIGTSFAINMIADYKAAVNTVLAAQAKYAAEAGLNMAIIDMRKLATSDFNAVPTPTSTPPCDWNYISATQPSFDLCDNIAGNSVSFSLGNTGRGNIAVFSLKVIDTASQININVVDNTSGNPDTSPQAVMLENLVTILGSPLQAGDGIAIIHNRSGGYLTKSQIIDVLPPSPHTSANLAARTAKFNKIAPYITVNSYVDENSESSTAPALTGLSNSTYQRKAPVNINTADAKVLRAILAPVLTSTDPAELAGDIITRRNANFFTSWNDFNAFIDILAYPSTAEKVKIENNANPNKVKVDKDGVAFSYTTDFCFQPSGVYEITSTGTVGASQKQITALVQIYDIKNYTTKEQFRGNIYTVIPYVYDGTLPDYKNVNWLNSCPVVSTYDHGLSVDPPAYFGATANAIANSLKLGFWDNFDEDNDNVNQAGWSWRNWKDVSSFGHDISITDVNPVDPSASNPPNLTDGDNELSDTAVVGSTGIAYIDLQGTESGQWNCNQEFSLRVYCNILRAPPSQVWGQTSTFYDNTDRCEGYEDTEQIDFVPAGVKGQMCISSFRYLYNPLQIPIDGFGDGMTPPSDMLDSMLRLDFYGGGGDHYMHLNSLYNSIGGLSPSGTQVPADANRVTPVNATFRLIVHGSTGNNYQVYLAVSPTGIAYHEWCDATNASPPREADGGAWVPWYWQIHYLTYYAADTAYHQFSDSGETDRYNFMWHDQSANQFIYNDWYLRLVNHCNTVKGRYALFDEVRLIPDTGYYISPTIPSASNTRFGTASWTLTIPSTASAASETAAVDISTDGGANFSSVGINGGANTTPVTSASMRFRVTLSSADPQHLQTPVLEDITLTRLSKAAVLYRK